MSRAFVKDSADEGALPTLPDRPISPHPNYVTPEGLAAIEAELAKSRNELAAVQAGEDKDGIARVGRDVRYWTSRRASAQVIEPPPDKKTVHFGSTVTIQRHDGRRHTYRIVGEDEADPAKGSIPYVSPLARALAGRAAGETVEISSEEVEILAIS
jgi:transcription elongation GreA/GreB family factor